MARAPLMAAQSRHMVTTTTTKRLIVGGIVFMGSFYRNGAGLSTGVGALSHSQWHPCEVSIVPRKLTLRTGTVK